MITTEKTNHTTRRRPNWKRILVGALALTFLLSALATLVVISHAAASPTTQLANDAGSGTPINVPRQLNTPLPTQPPDQVETCASAPSARFCNHQDPIAQGCAADAQTLPGYSNPIVHGGVTVGKFEVRYSRKCNSYWGRTTSFVDGVAETDVFQPFEEHVVGPFRGGVQQTYSDMAFGSIPEMTGEVQSN
jgi:hypothetical protein